MDSEAPITEYDPNIYLVRDGLAHYALVGGILFLQFATYRRSMEGDTSKPGKSQTEFSNTRGATAERDLGGDYISKSFPASDSSMPSPASYDPQADADSPLNRVAIESVTV